MADKTEVKMQSDALYDVIYGLAAGKGREQALFGSCAPLARQAFLRSLAGEEFPVIWFEIPLLDEPRFDLHVALSRGALRGDVRFDPGAGNGYDELMRWYAEEEEGGGGLAFAYDVSEGRIDDPAIHVNINLVPLDDMERFFDLAAGDGAARLYANFASRLPQGWHLLYTGVHPGRPGAPVRVDCTPSAELQEAYAADVSLLEADLRACGFTAVGPALRDFATLILDSPFGLELQFDVMRDGSVGSTLGMSACFPFSAPDALRSLFGKGGSAEALLREVERRGLADDRWRLIPDAAFAKLVPIDGVPLVLYCAPTFLKLRMRDGKPFDAKVYLRAGSIASGGRSA